MCCLCFVYICIHCFPLLHKTLKGRAAWEYSIVTQLSARTSGPCAIKLPEQGANTLPPVAVWGSPQPARQQVQGSHGCLAFWPLYLQYGIHMACNNTSEISLEEPRKRFCQMTDDGSVWMHGFSEGAAMQSYLSKCLLFLASWAPAGCPMAYLLRQPIHLAYRKENGCVFLHFVCFLFFFLWGM